MNLRAWKRSIIVIALVPGALAWAFVGTGTAAALSVRYVSPSGSDSGDCTSSPCKTINYAIGQSTSGDTIKVAAGTYTERVVLDRSLTIAGAGMKSTVVDGAAAGTVVTIGAASSLLDVTISGLTVRNGLAEAGGGIASVPGAGQTNRVTLVKVAASNNRAVGADGEPGGDGSGGRDLQRRGQHRVHQG